MLTHHIRLEGARTFRVDLATNTALTVAEKGFKSLPGSRVRPRRDSVDQASTGLQLTVNKIKAIGCVLTRGVQSESTSANEKVGRFGEEGIT